MTRNTLYLVSSVVLLCTAFEACRRETPAPVGPAKSAAPKECVSAASEALDVMDARTPLPLLPMMANHQKEEMRGHLAAVQQIVAAFAVDDYVAIEAAAGRMGFSEETAQMCSHMGAGAPEFTERALAFHHTADRIGVAARARDRAGVLVELGATLETCTSCHSEWKQQVVDEATWNRLTSAAPP
jgi:hypothetical protein